MRQKYYYIHMSDDGGGRAYAPTPPKEKWYIERFKDYETLPFALEVRDGPLQDFLSNNLSALLYSMRMYKCMSYFCDGNARWINVEVVTVDGERHPYKILTFKEDKDILDKEKTTMNTGGGGIIKLVLDNHKAEGMDVIPYPNWSFSVIISDRVRRELIRNKFSGMKFSLVPMT